MQGRVYCGILQETKITNRVYMREFSSFWVTVTAVSSAHRGVVIFYRNSEHLAIEDPRLHGPNAIIFQMVKRRWQWHVVGCYMDLRNALTI